MKKLILFLCICSFFSCKKDAANDITKYNWVLDQATVNPAMTVNGKTTTDYKNINGPGSCLASNFTYVFLTDGTYKVGSSGALCDMSANSDPKTWIKDGAKITLMNGLRGTSTATVEKNKMEQITVFRENSIDYTIKYIFKAKSK